MKASKSPPKPMNKEKLQQLKKVIQDAVPEIMELKFGCLCQNNWSDSHSPYKFIRKFGSYTIFYSEQFNKEIQMETKRRQDEDREPYKILGRPITLANVLIAFEKKFGKQTLTPSVLKSELYMDKLFNGVNVGNGKNNYKIPRWDLTKDLDNQPPEVHKFLYKLLVK